MLEKCSSQDSSSLGCLSTRISNTDVFCGRAKDKLFFAVFCIGATLVWFVMNKCLHPNRNKWMFVVVMMAIDMCIGGYVGM